MLLLYDDNDDDDDDDNAHGDYPFMQFFCFSHLKKFVMSPFK